MRLVLRTTSRSGLSGYARVELNSRKFQSGQIKPQRGLRLCLKLRATRDDDDEDGDDDDGFYDVNDRAGDVEDDVEDGDGGDDDDCRTEHERGMMRRLERKHRFAPTLTSAICPIAKAESGSRLRASLQPHDRKPSKQSCRKQPIISNYEILQLPSAQDSQDMVFLRRPNSCGNNCSLVCPCHYCCHSGILAAYGCCSIGQSCASATATVVYATGLPSLLPLCQEITHIRAGFPRLCMQPLRQYCCRYDCCHSGRKSCAFATPTEVYATIAPSIVFTCKSCVYPQ